MGMQGSLSEEETKILEEIYPKNHFTQGIAAIAQGT
jgi:hypothetical protein